MCLACEPFNQLQNFPQLPAPLEQRESPRLEAVSKAELKHDKQLVEDDAILVQLSAKPVVLLIVIDTKIHI